MKLRLGPDPTYTTVSVQIFTETVIDCTNQNNNLWKTNNSLKLLIQFGQCPVSIADSNYTMLEIMYKNEPHHAGRHPNNMQIRLCF